MAKELKGTKTHENLKHAFAGESMANRRYLYFARLADVEGYPEVAGHFRDTAEGETGHAHGHLDYLKQVGDPATESTCRSDRRRAEPEGGGCRRNLRVHADVPWIREVGSRRRLRRDLRLVRDAGARRERRTPAASRRHSTT